MKNVLLILFSLGLLFSFAPLSAETPRVSDDSIIAARVGFRVQVGNRPHHRYYRYDRPYYYHRYHQPYYYRYYSPYYQHQPGYHYYYYNQAPRHYHHWRR